MDLVDKSLSSATGNGIVTPQSGTPVVAILSAPSRRPLRKRMMHLIRRGHLYFGLFLFPWAVLYGVTGFLFNHPTAFSDVPTTSFGKDELQGTPMETPPIPVEEAKRVVAALQQRFHPQTPYQLVHPETVGYNREFAFATIKMEGEQVSLLMDVKTGNGTVRNSPIQPPKETEKAPFAIGRSENRGSRPMAKKEAPKQMEPSAEHRLDLENPLHERVKTSIPTILERTGFPQGDVTVTSVPDLTFQMDDGEKIWQVSFNAQTGVVSGKPLDEVKSEGISLRRFLLRLHLSHGYPSSMTAKWFWAVLVDGMAFVMVFWGLSGLLMWWQIKASRKAGLVVLTMSALAATALGIGMHTLFTQS